jgi:hypothetical protein
MNGEVHDQPGKVAHCRAVRAAHPIRQIGSDINLHNADDTQKFKYVHTAREYRQCRTPPCTHEHLNRDPLTVGPILPIRGDLIHDEPCIVSAIDRLFREKLKHSRKYIFVPINLLKPKRIRHNRV